MMDSNIYDGYDLEALCVKLDINGSQLCLQAASRIRSLMNEQVVDVRQLVADYEAADDDDGWESPHPIFLMAQELDALRAKLAAMESQSPGGKVIKWIDSNTAICSGDGFAAADIDAEIYFKPAPADKPAVAVPQKIDPTLDGGYYDDCYINGWNACVDTILAAAPSHSQQSDAVDLLRQIFELYEDGVDCYENPDEGAGYLGKAFRIDHDTYKLCVELLDSSEDRCPSHESEQQ